MFKNPLTVEDGKVDFYRTLTNCCVGSRLASVELICLCHRPTCTAEGLGTVQPPGVNFDEYEAIRGDSLTQRIFKLLFRTDLKAEPSSEYVDELVIVPGLDIVLGAITDHTFDRISVIIDEKDDRLEMVPDHRREVLTSNLKRPIPHKQDGTPVLRCHTSAQGCSNRIADRSVEGLPYERHSVRHEHFRGTEKGHACFSNDD